MGSDCGPSESAAHSGSVRGTKGPGAELEAAGAPQPQNRIIRHHLGVTARGGMCDQCMYVCVCVCVCVCERS